jgi:hypothetical protein
MFPNIIAISVVGRGRSAALLAGPNPKKRKLNQIGADQNPENIMQQDQAKKEVLELKAILADLSSKQEALMKHCEANEIGLP